MMANTDVKTRLLAYLKELHLPTIRASFEYQARRAQQETLSYEQYLLELTRAESEARCAHRIERFLRQSRILLEKDLASFDLKRLPVAVARQVRTLLDGSFLDRRENLLVFGKAGSGKTHLVSALSQELIRAGRKVCFQRDHRNCLILGSFPFPGRCLQWRRRELQRLPLRQRRVG